MGVGQPDLTLGRADISKDPGAFRRDMPERAQLTLPRQPAYDPPVDQDRLGKTAIAVPSERPKGLGSPCLVVIAGPGLGQQYDLGDTIVDIGRQEECVISIPSSKVSRRHASVQRVLGRYTVADLGSTNGTFLNGHRLDKAEQLTDGDKIKVGELVLKYMESKIELQYHQQILSMATTDALTGTHNKRSFDEAFPNAALRSQADQSALCLVLFDVDHFKVINDSYGHAAGDTVLRELGTLSQSVADPHRVYRVGGEEFAVLVSEGNEVARSLAEMLRMRVQEHRFFHDQTLIPVSISAGFAELFNGEAAQGLYQRADQNLYLSKNGGRNRVTGP
jgi:diguanylate cyclase (GGDEF)-like protein